MMGSSHNRRQAAASSVMDLVQIFRTIHEFQFNIPEIITTNSSQVVENCQVYSAG